MSLATPVAVLTVHPLLYWRRDYAGELLTIQLIDGRSLRVTPGHPILTHLGWRRADLLTARMRVVATPGTPGVSAAASHLAARGRYGEHRLPTVRSDFRGDGGRYDTHAVCLDVARGWPPSRPYVGDEGTSPKTSPSDVATVLDALLTPIEFGVATWGLACAKVPGLAEVYPGGPPPRHNHIDPVLRARLGRALEALPDMPFDRADLGRRLFGVAIPLGFVEVTAVTLEPSTAVVHDVTDANGCVTAAGVVVGA